MRAAQPSDPTIPAGISLRLQPPRCPECLRRAPRHGVLPSLGTCSGEHMPVLRTQSPRASGCAQDIPSCSTNDTMSFVSVAVLEPGSC